MQTLPLSVFVLRLFLALLLGAMIGFERELKQRNAGLVTNALVAVGSAVYILVSVNLFHTQGGDPARIAAQVVTGIGFLGAGVIMREGFSVFGINTAATIWCSAAVGCLSGFGYWKEAVIAACAIVTAHIIFRPVSNWVGRHTIRRRYIKEIGYVVNINAHIQDENIVRTAFVETLSHLSRFQLRSLQTQENKEEGTVLIRGELLCYGRPDKTIESFVSQLVTIPQVHNIRWEVLKQNLE